MNKKLPTYVLTVIFADGGKTIYKTADRNQAMQKLDRLKQVDNVANAEITNGQSSLKVFSGRRV